MDEQQSRHAPPTRAPVVHDLDPDDDLGHSEDDQARTQTCSNQNLPNKKSRKQTSEAWDYFDKIEVNGEPKAQCKYCNAILSAGSANGTTHLKKHAKTVCSGRHLNLLPGQTRLKVKTEVDGSSTLEFKGKDKEKEFSQEVSRNELVNMVVMHEYPLSMVDHIGFRRYSESLNPSFKMISRNTLKSDILKRYTDDKKSLKALLTHNGSRISITTDMWTASNQKKSYMVVTSHFIDQQWVLRNRTLRFCFVPSPHTKGILAKVLMECLSQYSLENKISSIVVDNCSANDAMMRILLDKFERNSLMLDGDFLHMRCSAHILNLIVQDGLTVIKHGVADVRDCVAFWMSTPKRIEKFEEACRFLNLPNSKRLVLEIERVRKVLDKLVLEYQKKNVGMEDQETHLRTSGGNATQTPSMVQEDGYAQSKRTKKRKVSGRCEVDYYIEDETLPEDEEFDILYWWKKDIKYPTLRMIAKDILAIPVSTVASESAFSMGGRVISPHRSRLTCTTVEALMCLQNWMMEDIKGTLEGTHACSTVNDDSDVEGEVIDMIDMDLDDDDVDDDDDDDMEV